MTTDFAIQFTDDDKEIAVPLAVVPPELLDDPEPLPDESLPEFESARVATTEIKISGACAIDTHGALSVSLDDMIRAVGVYRVTKVNHYVNKAGDVVRQQVLSPVESLEVVPWDATNVHDDGIVRARP